MAQINAYVTDDVKKRLNEKAVEMDRSASYIISKLVLEFLGIDKEGNPVKKRRKKN